ncbi:hypothetical protein F2Q69_00060093 [Brassica cretica]|uniref:Uncharacterized protein n=1 Tax=Brassica cretica TaxID=69181 RepID=A0A8S9RHR1_BRACR|nr:hypothetical protein F2Q69_00060093 [Brassica cretica]
MKSTPRVNSISSLSSWSPLSPVRYMAVNDGFWGREDQNGTASELEEENKAVDTKSRLQN